ncbi:MULTISPECIES: hypothetical protein [Mesorhizobium]|nr:MULTISPECIES: hypothetical protein [Mesorhizobium]MDF3216821.1 hypothetical protein [Mesorhizobium ciceri]
MDLITAFGFQEIVKLVEAVRIDETINDQHLASRLVGLVNDRN